MLKALRLRAIPLVWLVCCIFIALQLLGAHAHQHVALGSDAQPAHVSIGVLHAEPEQAEHGHDHAHLQHASDLVQHQDIELPAISGPAHGLLDLLWTGFCAFAALALWLLAQPTSSVVPIYRLPRSLALVRYAWPPFRGPPMHFVA